MIICSNQFSWSTSCQFVNTFELWTLNFELYLFTTIQLIILTYVSQYSTIRVPIIHPLNLLFLPLDSETLTLTHDP